MDWGTWGPVMFAGVVLPVIGAGLSLREQFKTHDALDTERFDAISKDLKELKDGQTRLIDHLIENKKTH